MEAGGDSGDESEGLVLINRDDHRNHQASISLRHSIEFLAERHDVDTMLGYSAGPTGGAGLACPAGICNLM